MLLDSTSGQATTMGEIHRKFIVTPELDCMLDDFARFDAQRRIENEEKKRQEEEKLEKERSRFGGLGIAGVGARRLE